MAPPEGSAAACISLPARFDRFFATEGTTWVVLKVKPELNWRVEFAGRCLRPLAADVLYAGTSGGQHLGLRSNGTEARRFTVLRPRRPGGHTLVPACLVNAVWQVGVPFSADGGSVDAGAGPMLRIRLLETDVDTCAPLAFWQQGRVGSKEIKSGVHFKCYDASVGSQQVRSLVGRYNDAPGLRLASERKQTLTDSGVAAVRHLVGAYRENSSKLYLAEADLFPISHHFIWEHNHDEVAAACDPEVEQVDYMKARSNAVQLFGVAKWQRLDSLVPVNRGDGSRIHNLEESLADLRSHADEQTRPSSGSSAIDQAMAVRRQLLPPIDFETDEPSSIFRFAEVVPDECLASLANDEMMELLQMQAKHIEEKPRAEVIALCSSRTVLTLVITRAQLDMMPASLDAKNLAGRFGVLHRWMGLYKAAYANHKRGFKFEEFAAAVGLGADAPAAHKWFQEFTERGGIEGPHVRSEKLLLFIITWIFSLAPYGYFDFRCLQEDLSLDCEMLKMQLVFAGCTETDRNPMKATLVAPFKVYMSHHRPKRAKRRGG
eukprot:NODE_3416_length_2039_cov_8.752615.p1 GENE.NODE_3416_length_2039_cov_8.752615~~NODE_3416_length_2039_cov_8.752615.p1  ORF type:complete len:577 (+),score=143.56 NODE_3416_length_2039_cov_8.752615:96-1733(+)